MSEPRERIEKYLARFIPGRPLLGDDDLFALGIITSLSAMQLVAFVEREFDLTIENEDLSRDNFRSVDALTTLIERKRAA
jgi:methoxymalonate biosynthesis acyl carrier protein